MSQDFDQACYMIYIYIYVCIYAYVYVYVYMCICVCVSVCMYVYVYVYVYFIRICNATGRARTFDSGVTVTCLAAGEWKHGSTCQPLIIDPPRASEPISARQYSDWMKYYRECAELEPEVNSLDAHNRQVFHVGGSSNKGLSHS